MSIRIAFPAQFADLIGCRESVTVAGVTVGGALRALTAAHPALATLVWARGSGLETELNPVVVVFRNGEDVRGLGTLEASVKDGDELLVISAVEGG